jgi:serine/threonine protein kinase
LRDLVGGVLKGKEADEIRAHLTQCERCQAVIERLKRELSTVTLTAIDVAPPSGGEAAIPTEPTRQKEALGDEENEPEEEETLAEIPILLPPSTPGAVGKIGTYEVLGVLGRGAMGIVLKALDKALHRTVAIKVLSPQLASSPKARRRFLREARAAAGINHPNVVTIHAVEEQAGIPYLVMEYVRGHTLRDRIKTSSPLNLTSILRVSAQIADGLAAAHEHGVVHRDVKPGNILLEDGIERVKVSDFGLATVVMDASQLTSAGRTVGTPAYMSPEQVAGSRVDGRSDLFSLGCVMYAMVARKSPFRGTHALEVAHKILEHTPPPLCECDPSVPGFLSEIVDRLLEKDPERRYQSAGVVRDMLRAHLTAAASEEPVSRTAIEPRPQRGRSRRRLVFASLAFLTVLLIGAVAVSVWLWRRDIEPLPGPSVEVVSPSRVLTVAQSGDADFASLGVALRRCSPRTTVRVLDDATYREALVVNNPATCRGLTLEAKQGATLAPPVGFSSALRISNTPDVTVRGLAVQTAVSQFAILIEGKAEGVTLENVTCTQSEDTQWANVYLAEGAHGSPENPITIRSCVFESSFVGIMIQGGADRAAASVEVENNRFTGRAKHHVMLHEAIEGIVIRGNVFEDEGQGVRVSLSAYSPSGRIRIGNNTFYGKGPWLSLTNPELAEDVVVYNNLVLGSESIGHQEWLAGLAQWSFHNNVWEPSGDTDVDAARQVAELREDVGLLSRERDDANFLHPIPGSPLGTGGAGGALPEYVGAFPPTVGKE